MQDTSRSRVRVFFTCVGAKRCPCLVLCPNKRTLRMKCFGLSIHSFPHTSVLNQTLPLFFFSHQIFTNSIFIHCTLGLKSIATTSLLLLSFISTAIKLNHVSSGLLMLMHSLVSLIVILCY